MRTTLTLELEIALQLEQEMSRNGKGLKAVVNDALRLGLGMAGKPVEPPPVKVQPHDFGFPPGTDFDRMNQLSDELEAEDALRKSGA